MHFPSVSSFSHVRDSQRAAQNSHDVQKIFAVRRLRRKYTADTATYGKRSLTETSTDGMSAGWFGSTDRRKLA
jgi:hypothetical protein